VSVCGHRLYFCGALHAFSRPTRHPAPHACGRSCEPRQRRARFAVLVRACGCVRCCAIPVAAVPQHQIRRHVLALHPSSLPLQPPGIHTRSSAHVTRCSCLHLVTCGSRPCWAVLITDSTNLSVCLLQPLATTVLSFPGWPARVVRDRLHPAEPTQQGHHHAGKRPIRRHGRPAAGLPGRQRHQRAPRACLTSSLRFSGSTCPATT